MADRVQEYRFRGYVRRIGNRWYVNIIDLSLDAEADALPEAMQKIDDAMVGYFKTVLAKNLGKEFLHRPSSWEHHCYYYWCKLKNLIHPVSASGTSPKHPSVPPVFDRNLPKMALAT